MQYHRDPYQDPFTQNRNSHRDSHLESQRRLHRESQRSNRESQRSEPRNLVRGTSRDSRKVSTRSGQSSSRPLSPRPRMPRYLQCNEILVVETSPDQTPTKSSDNNKKGLEEPEDKRESSTEKFSRWLSILTAIKLNDFVPKQRLPHAIAIVVLVTVLVSAAVFGIVKASLNSFADDHTHVKILNDNTNNLRMCESTVLYGVAVPELFEAMNFVFSGPEADKKGPILLECECTALNCSTQNTDRWAPILFSRDTDSGFKQSVSNSGKIFNTNPINQNLIDKKSELIQSFDVSRFLTNHSIEIPENLKEFDLATLFYTFRLISGINQVDAWKMYLPQWMNVVKLEETDERFFKVFNSLNEVAIDECELELMYSPKAVKRSHLRFLSFNIMVLPGRLVDQKMSAMIPGRGISFLEVDQSRRLKLFLNCVAVNYDVVTLQELQCPLHLEFVKTWAAKNNWEIGSDDSGLEPGLIYKSGLVTLVNKEKGLRIEKVNFKPFGVAQETDLVVRQGVLKVSVSTVFTNFDVISFYLPPSWKYMYMTVRELEKASQALARKQALETALSVVDSKLPTIVSGTANLNRVQQRNTKQAK